MGAKAWRRNGCLDCNRPQYNMSCLFNTYLVHKTTKDSLIIFYHVCKSIFSIKCLVHVFETALSGHLKSILLRPIWRNENKLFKKLQVKVDTWNGMKKEFENTGSRSLIRRSQALWCEETWVPAPAHPPTIVTYVKYSGVQHQTLNK